EGEKVEALRQHEDVGDDVAAAARDAERQVVAAGARIGVGAREAVEAARELERARRIAQRRTRALRTGPSAALLGRPDRREQPLAVREQVAQRHGELLTVLEMLGDGDFA